MKIAFLLNHIPNPRFNKRIREFSSWAEVDVICVHRVNMSTYSLDKIKGVNYHVMDMVMPPSSSPIGRIKAVFQFKSFAKKSLKEIRPDIIYVNGVDVLLIATLACKGAKICQEVADLREYCTSHGSICSIQGLADRVLRIIEKKLSHKVSLLVVTSRKFYDVYYSKFMAIEKVLEVPNMPVLSAFRNYQPKNDGKFTIGFVGALRYFDQMRMLVDAAGETDVNVVFAGGTSHDTDKSFIKYCEGKPWVKFTGEYNFSTDIAGIYGSIDCVYSVYDASNFNVRIALPNKLYEAVICHIPIIVARGTYLFELVNEWGVGVGVAYDDIGDLKNAIEKLKSKGSYYQKFVENCKSNENRIDAQYYLDKLNKRVKELA